MVDGSRSMEHAVCLAKEVLPGAFDFLDSLKIRIEYAGVEHKCRGQTFNGATPI